MKSPPPPPTSGSGSATPASKTPSITSTPPPPDYDWLEDEEESTAVPLTVKVPEPDPEPVHVPKPVVSSPNLVQTTTYIPSKRSDFVCPYCMRDIYIGDLLYFCKRCKKAYSNAEAQSAGLGRVVKKQYYCCNGSITGSRFCPNCKILAENNGIALENLRLLPQEVYNVKNEFRVCMTGYSSSGKTQYITQLMDYVVKYSLPDIDCTYFLDNKTQDIREAIRRRFFIDGKIAATSSGYLEPLLFDIRRGKRSYISVFYDIAGEDFRENRDTLATRCIWSSRNILLIIDPTTLPGPDIKNHPRVIAFKSQSSESGDSKASEGEVIEPLNTYTGFVRMNHPQGEKFLKRVNLAIVFPKMDLFYDDDDFPDILKRESSHIVNDKFAAKEVNAVSEAMKQWILRHEGDALIKALRQYSNVQIFGVSSGSDDLSRESRTNRLLDPYLWLLHQNSIL